MRPIANEIYHQLRFALPIWILWLLTNWWPNNRVTIRVRGWLHRPFFKKCGRGFAMGRGVTILNPQNIEVGDNVYLAHYVWLNGLGGIVLEDEVMLGPFVTISSLGHTCRKGSFRFSGSVPGTVRIGRGSFLAAHVSVAYGVTIGAGCLICANAAVVRDVPPGTIAGGVPAEPLGPCEEREATLTSRCGWRSVA
jgi:acetyltransferase-like isoleucine patch superfamily enzyme